MTIRTVEIDFEYMNYVDAPPRQAKDLYSQACSNDGVTINTWKKTWLSQIKANREKYGSFSEKSIGKLYNSKKLQPAILMGSGPSLKNNIHLLKDVKDIVKISCLHNFHYCEDHDVHVDYYVSLDAGEITLNEMAIGGKKTLEEYLEATRNKTLLCYIGSHPNLSSYSGTILPP